MPLRGEGRQGLVVSIIVHALIVLLVLFPIVLAGKQIVKIEQGAGGPGPAGGGGGGRVGDYVKETLRFVKLSPTPVPTPKTLPPVPVQVVPKVIPPPVIPPPQVQQQPSSSPSPMASITSVPGIGTGRDGSNGNGPGSGGGVGSGDGTGRGSGRGPGTGGGNQVNYPPQPIEFFLPPLPPPASVKGFHFIAEFDVDSTGKVLNVEFSHTRDGDYNNRLDRILHSMRFKPGTRPDGTPLRMKAQVGYEF